MGIIELMLLSISISGLVSTSLGLREYELAKLVCKVVVISCFSSRVNCLYDRIVTVGVEVSCIVRYFVHIY